MLGKSFREELKVEPKLGILEALKSVGLDASLLVNDMIKGNIIKDVGRELGIPEKEASTARLDKEQVDSLRKLIDKNGNYRTLEDVDMRGYAYHIAVSKNNKGDIVFATKHFGRRNEGVLRDTDIFSKSTYNKDGIEMEYSAREYYSDEPIYNQSAIATTDIKRREDLVTQTIYKTGEKTSSLFRNDPMNDSLRKGVVLIDEDRPDTLRKSAYSTGIDYTKHNVHSYDRQNRLTALYKKTKFNFRNYSEMPKDVQQEMEKIERDVETGRE